MKVIFLDFDGVLNSRRYLMSCGEQALAIDPARMALLKEIVDATGANLVLSTSWREHWSVDPNECDSTGRLMNEIFCAHGMQIFDKTPKLSASRTEEIKSWLAAHPEITHFVVLDDMFLGDALLAEHFVKTSYYTEGLSKSEAEEAIAILKREGGAEHGADDVVEGNTETGR